MGARGNGLAAADKHGAAIELVSETRAGPIQASLDGERSRGLRPGPVVSEPQGAAALNRRSCSPRVVRMGGDAEP